MNNTIRQQIRLELSKRDMSQSQLAADIGVSRQYLSNIMRGVSGNIPSVWNRIFDVFGLELVVQPKQNAPADIFLQHGNNPKQNE